MSKKVSENLVMLIENKPLPIDVTRYKNSKRLKLRIAHDGQKLNLTVPFFVKKREIKDFLQWSRDWVTIKLANMPKPVILEEGSQIYFRGAIHDLLHIDKPKRLVQVKYVNGRSALLISGKKEYFGNYIIDFLRQQARQDFQLNVLKYSRQLAVQPKKIRITDTKSRWGSCSTLGTLSFSWRIVMAPPEILSYIAAHEVAHLREMNHSKNFWKLVEKLCPDMENNRQWLRINGKKLHTVVSPDSLKST